MDILQMCRKDVMPTPEDALPGRGDRMPVTHAHTVLGNPLKALDPSFEVAMFGLGCFCAERSSGKSRCFHYSGRVCSGYTPNPTYREVLWPNRT